MTALFLLATLLPFLVASRVVRGWRGGLAVPEDRVRFEALVLGTGGLSALLHALLFTGLLSIPAVAASGAAALIVAWMAGRAGVLASSGLAAAAGSTSDVDGGLAAWMARVSVCAVAAVCGVWFAWSAASLEVAGTDAAHYHIPHAVNYALGASPWGPMPTRHAYPMGASVLFAWFILPFGDAFVADASMVLWYLVLLAALASLFHTLTGLHGWTWVPWFAMMLFGLPLVQSSALPSADLPYAASFLAVSAQLAWMVSRSAVETRDWVVLGVSLGLLVGCKTPGVYSAAVLSAAAITARVGMRRRLTIRMPARWPNALAAVAVAGVLTGGVWLIRNAWLFGHPVETYTDRYFLSVMQDVRTVYRGDWLYAAWRAGIKIARLLHPRFLASGAATIWLVIESATVLLRRRPDALAATRLWFVGLMALVAGVHVAGLVGAPWTSLEWTGGSSLRYLLPFWVLYSFLAFAGLFSRLLPWYRIPGLHAAGWLLLAAAGAWPAASHVGPGGINPGAERSVALIATVALVAGAALNSRSGRSLPERGSWLRRLSGVAVVILAVVGVAGWLASRHATLRAAAVRSESDTLRSWLVMPRPGVEAHRQVFLDVRAHEVRTGADCRRRRFFVASRFDFPLELQPASYTSLVFDSRTIDAVLPLIRERPNAGTCDYAIVGRDETGRQAIQLSSDWLRPIESTGRFLAYAVVRPPDPRRSPDE